jgi:hypothetical protein
MLKLASPIYHRSFRDLAVTKWLLSIGPIMTTPTRSAPLGSNGQYGSPGVFIVVKNVSKRRESKKKSKTRIDKRGSTQEF